MKLFGYEITIKRIGGDREQARMGRRRWTRSETDTLLRFLNEGRSYEEIGDLLHRTDKAIINRVSKIRRGGVQYEKETK
jgi:DNA-binding NarL/FixJ family response regulator